MMKPFTAVVVPLLMAGLLMMCAAAPDDCAAQEKAGVPSLQAPAITPDELHAILDEPDVLVLDVRIETDWEGSRNQIPGAVRKDPNAVDAWAEEIDKGKRVITY